MHCWCLRHECLYFDHEVLQCFGLNLNVHDTYLRFIYLNSQNYLWKVGWDMLETNAIYSTMSTTCYPYYDMVIGFNPSTLLGLIPLTIVLSGSLGGEYHTFIITSNNYKRTRSRRALFDPCDGDWVYIQRRWIRTQRRSKLHPKGDGPYHSIAIIETDGYSLLLLGKFVNVDIFDVANVISFGAGSDSRSNPFEGRGDDVIRSAQHINEHWANVGKGPKPGSSLHEVTTSHTINGSSHGARKVEVDMPRNKFDVGVEGQKSLEGCRIKRPKWRPTGSQPEEPCGRIVLRPCDRMDNIREVRCSHKSTMRLHLTLLCSRMVVILGGIFYFSASFLILLNYYLFSIF